MGNVDEAASSMLWDQFLEAWPESRVQSMSLSEYTAIGNQESFCYWVEARLETLGSIWGGNAFKFGIYARGDRTAKPPHTRYTYTDDYAWESKFGNSAAEVFEQVKKHIVTAIRSVKARDLQSIEELPLWPVFKWKIAFLYQDRNDPLLPAVFKPEMLSAYLETGDAGHNTPFPALYHWVMKERNDRDIMTFSRDILTKANQILDKQKFKPSDAEQLLVQRYQPIGEGTDKVIGFVNESGRTLALNRTGKSVRLTMEPWNPAIKHAKLVRQYAKNDPRNSNFGSQAPKVAVGNEAILLECAKQQAFETLLDEYEMVDFEETGSQPIHQPAASVGIQQPLNQILYGPPGTGKTYHTVNKALEILDPEFYYDHEDDREALNRRFQALSAAGTIGFVTFHQSFSYEDFVEGLRANAADGQVSYEVEDGIFKVMCASPDEMLEEGTAEGVDVAGRQVWKMSLGNTLGSDAYIFENCVAANEIRLGWGRDADFSDATTRDAVKEKLEATGYDTEERSYSVTAVDIFRNQMNIGDLVVISDGNTKFRAIAEITGDYHCDPIYENGIYGQARKVTWHRVYESSLPYQRIMNKKFSQMTIYKLKPKNINLDKLQSLLRSSDNVGQQPKLAAGMVLDKGSRIYSISDELVRVKGTRSDSLIPFDMLMLQELAGLVRGGELTIEDIAKKRVFDKVNTSLEKFIVNGYSHYLADLVQAITGSDQTPQPKGGDSTAKVLIIDEINRGNISSIFGELITLIEPSKRAGAEEALSVTLPYSKDTFQVPKDLYLIGTMNTADRSLALIDTALRRRFDFVEMMPDVGLLEGVEVKGIDVANMLTIMNKRIEVLFDREHTLGHAFFIPLNAEEDDEQRFELLQSIFANKILPLLEEYFFEDWAKIRLVLGDDNKAPEYQFISENGADFDTEALFGRNARLDYGVEENKLYSRNAQALNHVESYIGIYED